MSKIDSNQSISWLLTEERVGIKNLKNTKAFINYSQTIDDIVENLEDYNQIKKRIVLIVFIAMIADIEYNKKISPIVTELFLRGRKFKISIVLTLQSYFKVPKTMKLNLAYCFTMKIPNKRELKRIASNQLFDIGFKYFMKLYKDYTKQPFSFSSSDTTFLSDNPLRFKKSVLQK